MSLVAKLNNRLAERWFLPLLFITLTLLPILLYIDYFLNDMVFLSGDGLQFFAPKITLMTDAIRTGEFPLWNKYINNGAPFAADQINGVWYPMNWIFVLMPTKIGFYVYYALHLACGSLFMYLYLKEIGCSPSVALVFAILYELSIGLGGYRKSHMNIITGITFLPIILYMLHVHFRTAKIKWLFLSSIMMALQTGTFLQIALYTDIVVFVYMIVLMVRNKVTIPKSIRKMLQWMGAYLGLFCVQLLPTLHMLMFYSSIGASSTAFDTFQSYSIHFIKLIQMIFPYFWGDHIMSFGASYSSEMDIEIFLGTSILLLALWGAIRYRKDGRIRTSLLIAAFAFLFAANAHVPLLSRLLYRIPVLNGFRVPARILFVFTFFILTTAAITLSRLSERPEAISFARFTRRFALVATAAVAAVVLALCTLYVANGNSTDAFDQLQHWLVKVFLPSLIALWAYALLSYLTTRDPKSTSKIKGLHLAMVPFVLIVTLFEVIPFVRETSPSPIDTFTEKDVASQYVYDHLGDQKVWDAFPSIDGSHHSIISQNRCVATRISAINSYITFNNPNLYRIMSGNTDAPYNFSGLLTGFFNAEEILLVKNDLLSMMGVRYIIDSHSLLANNNSILSKDFDYGDTILQENFISMPPTQDELTVFHYPISIKPDTAYIFDISYTTDQDCDSTEFYIDLYGGDSYDNAAQQRDIPLQAGAHSSSFALYTGALPRDAGVALRLVKQADAEILINELTVRELSNGLQDIGYLPFYSDGETSIYENPNAREILYVPSSVISIDDLNTVYDDYLNLDYASNSYIQGFKNLDLGNVLTHIEVLFFGNNSIEAQVSADSAAFLNFSQNYFPGWRAYIDGEETEIYMVNGLIQGIELPEGVHTVRFVFTSSSQLAGIIIALGTLAAIALCIAFENIRLKKKALRK